LYVKKERLPAISNFEVKYYIRGESVRKKQKEHLINRLKTSKHYDVKILNFNTLKKFKQKLKEFIINVKPNVINYLDLYRFLGDSFLSTYMHLIQ
jgi:hypothetical protein